MKDKREKLSSIGLTTISKTGNIETRKQEDKTRLAKDGEHDSLVDNFLKLFK